MSPVDRFVASVASRTPAQNAAILGVSEAVLLDAARPGSETFADYLATCPTVSIAATVEAEAVKLGRAPTDDEAQAAVSRAVLAAIEARADPGAPDMESDPPARVRVNRYPPAHPVAGPLADPPADAEDADPVAAVLLALSYMARIAERLATGRLLTLAAAMSRSSGQPVPSGRPTTGPADHRERCEPFARAMRRYRPRFRGDIERERGEGLRSCVDTGAPVHDAGPTAA